MVTLRKQENSFSELLTVVSVYLRPGGILMDPFCGTAVSCLAGLRVGARLCVMNDKDVRCVEAARSRALHYWRLLKKADMWRKPIFQPRSRERELAHVRAIENLLQEETFPPHP